MVNSDLVHYARAGPARIGGLKRSSIRFIFGFNGAVQGARRGGARRCCRNTLVACGGCRYSAPPIPGRADGSGRSLSATSAPTGPLPKDRRRDLLLQTAPSEKSSALGERRRNVHEAAPGERLNRPRQPASVTFEEQHAQRLGSAVRVHRSAPTFAPARVAGSPPRRREPGELGERGASGPRTRPARSSSRPRRSAGSVGPLSSISRRREAWSSPHRLRGPIGDHAERPGTAYVMPSPALIPGAGTSPAGEAPEVRSTSGCPQRTRLDWRP